MTHEVSAEWLGGVFPTLDRSTKVKKLYMLADKRSAGKTDHSLDRHGVPVMNMGVDLMEQIESIYPGTFTLEERTYSVPGVCKYHDMYKGWKVKLPDGTEVEIHHIKVARELNRILIKMGVPRNYRRLVTYPVRFHRTSGILKENGLVMPSGLNNEERAIWEACLRTLAILVLADKCVGDRERVRENRAKLISVLRYFGLAKVWFKLVADEDSRNNFATYAIHQARLCVDASDCSENPRGAIVLHLDLDEKVCSLTEILNVEWFSEAFHCCGVAAKYLGFSFRIVTRSVEGSSPEQVWLWSKELQRWSKPQTS